MSLFRVITRRALSATALAVFLLSPFVAPTFAQDTPVTSRLLCSSVI